MFLAVPIGHSVLFCSYLKFWKLVYIALTVMLFAKLSQEVLFSIKSLIVWP